MSGPIARAYVTITADASSIGREIEIELRKAFAGIDRLADRSAREISQSFSRAAKQSREALEQIDPRFADLRREADVAGRGMQEEFEIAAARINQILDVIGERALDDLPLDARQAADGVEAALRAAALASSEALSLIGEGAFRDLEGDARVAAKEVTDTLLRAAAIADAGLERIGEGVFEELHVDALAASREIQSAFAKAAAISRQSLRDIGGDAFLGVAADAQVAAEEVVLAFARAARAADEQLDTAIELDKARLFGEGVAGGEALEAGLRSGFDGGGGRGRQSFARSASLSFARTIVTAIGFAVPAAVGAFTLMGVKVTAEFQRIANGIQNVLSTSLSQLRIQNPEQFSKVFRGLFDLKGVQEDVNKAAELVGGTLQRTIERVALETPFGFQDLAAISQQLLATGRSANTLEADLRGISAAVSFFGAQGSDLKPLIRAIGQISGSTRVYQQDLNQITQRLPGFNARQELAFASGARLLLDQADAATLAAAGITQAQIATDGVGETVRKLRAAGLDGEFGLLAVSRGLDAIASKEVSGKQAADDLILAFQSIPGAAAGLDTLASSLSGQLERLKESAQLALRDGFAPLANFLSGGGVNILKGGDSFLVRLSETITTATAEFAAGVTEGVIAIADPLRELTGALAPIAGNLIGSLLKGLTPLVQLFADFFELNGDRLTETLDRVLRLAGILATIVIEPFVRAFELFLDVLEPFGPIIDLVIDALERFGPALLLLRLNPVIASLLVASFVIEHFGEIVDFVGRNLRTFIEVLSAIIFPPLAPFILLNRLFDDFLGKPIVGAFQAVAGAIDAVVDAAGGLGGIISGLAKFLALLAVPVVGPFLAIAAGIEAITNIDLGPIDDIIGAVGGVVDAVGGFVGSVAGGIGDAVSGIFGSDSREESAALKRSIDQITESLKGVVTGSEDFSRTISTQFSRLLDPSDLARIKSAGTSVEELTAQLLDGVKPSELLSDSLKRGLGGAGEEVEALAKKIEDLAKDSLKDATETGDEFLRKFATSELDLAKDGVKTYTQALNDATTQAADLRDKTLAGISINEAARRGYEGSAESLQKLGDALDGLRFPDALSKALGDPDLGGIGLTRDVLNDLAAGIIDGTANTALAFGDLAFELGIGASDVETALAATTQIIEERITQLGAVFSRLSFADALQPIDEFSESLKSKFSSGAEAVKAFTTNYTRLLDSLIAEQKNLLKVLNADLDDGIEDIVDAVVTNVQGTPDGATFISGIADIIGNPEQLNEVFQPILDRVKVLTAQTGLDIRAALIAQKITPDQLFALTPAEIQAKLDGIATAVTTGLAGVTAAFVQGRGPLTAAGAAAQAEIDRINAPLFGPIGGTPTASAAVDAAIGDVVAPAKTAADQAVDTFKTTAAAGFTNAAPEIATALAGALSTAFSLAGITVLVQGSVLQAQLGEQGKVAGTTFGTGFSLGASEGLDAAFATILEQGTGQAATFGAQVSSTLSGALVSGFLSSVGRVVATVSFLINAMRQQLVAGIVVATALAAAQFSSGLRALDPVGTAAGTRAGIAFAVALKQALVDGINAAVTVARVVLANALGNVSVLMGLLGVQAGRAFGEGIAQGIRSEIADIRAAGASAGRAASGGTSRELVIASPSKVGIEIGQFFGRGLAIGIHNLVGDVASAGRSLASAAVQNAGLSVPGLSAPSFGAGGSAIVGGGGGQAVQVVTEPQQSFAFNIDKVFTADPEALANAVNHRTARRVTNGGFKR